MQAFVPGGAVLRSLLPRTASPVLCKTHLRFLRPMPAAPALCMSASSAPSQNPAVVSSSSSLASERLSAIREELARDNVDAFIVPSSDPHFSEYSAACFGRRAWISCFSGSAGTAVVTRTEALLWTDGRYWLQAEAELGDEWSLMKAGATGTPTVGAYLAGALKKGNVVGVDALLHSVDEGRKLREVLGGAGVELKAVSNFVDRVWDDRPGWPAGQVRVHPIQHAGISAEGKVEMCRRLMGARGYDGLLVSALDEVAWLLNLRGDDVPHCPVVVSYVLVGSEKARWYVEDRKRVLAASGVAQALESAGVVVREYGDIVPDVRAMAASGGKVWMDGATTSLALGEAAGDKAVYETNPIGLAKAKKNDAELAGMKAAHVKDGAALASFFCWLEKRVNGPEGDISEYDAGVKLEEFRAKQIGFLSTSFDTIAGSGANGAIIHYSAEKETCAMVSNREVFLVDSGGQYVEGTTDVTRTMHLGGKAMQLEKECYTRVLQGHMALDMAVFPAGTTGFMLDALARAPLWSMGLEYRHGTGHGVGASLNVHEGPHSISPRVGSNKVALQSNMIVSNEPGYYADGKFGIRIENLMFVEEKKTDHNFAGATYLGFEKLTYVPIDTEMVCSELLSVREVEWLDEYHNDVWTVISPLLGEESPESDWLWRKTRPLTVANKTVKQAVGTQ